MNKKLSINFILFFIPILFFCQNLYSQPLSERRLHEFMNALFDTSVDIRQFISPDELAKSERLGIKYDGIKNKFLIGNDIDEKIKNEILSDNLEYTVTLKNVDNVYSVVELNLPVKNFIKNFYFENNYWISPITYFTKDWKKIESKYFVYSISDSTLINDYAIENMEGFLERVCAQLDCDKDYLAKQKIYYVLCKDQDEIEKVTGYKSLGMCDLAMDYVISTYVCHYHELSHLLINYKLQNISLYTNPFLQEGFAVAFGGRGGREPYILWDVGRFLAKSNFVDYKDLLNRQKFLNEDASITYPISGFYNYFLINEIGRDKYLELYRKYSTDKDKINNSEISLSDLPNEEKWKESLKSKTESIQPVVNIELKNVISKNDKVVICNLEPYYLIGVKDTMTIREITFKDNYYISSKFKEIFPGKKYNNEKYLIIANSKEITIYNLFTNNLIAYFAMNFYDPNLEIKKTNGFYYFTVLKNIFDNELGK